MYRITAIEGGREYLLHEPRDNSGELQVIGAKLTEEAGRSEVLTFMVSPNHPHIDKLVPLVTEIRAYDGETVIFYGRVRKDQTSQYNLREVTCEGEISYLCDSIQRPYDTTGTLVEFFTKVLEVHNSQTEERKRFEIGNISIAGGDREWISDSFETSLATIRGKLTDEYGGYLRVRRENGKRCLDYVTDYGGNNSQIIRFGQNLLDITKYRDPTSIITALIPRGAEIETDDTEEKRYVDITSVNGGKDFIFDQAAVDAYGWIFGGHDFKDAATPEDLLAKAKALLDESLDLPETLEINAVDLSLIDVDVSRFQVGYWTRVESVPHGISRQFLLSKKATYFDTPEKDRVWLGQTLPSFIGSQNSQKMEITERVQKVAVSASREINRKVENATKLITGGKGGYFVIGLSEDGHPEETFWMDTPNRDTSKNIVRINKNGIGFSTTGINGPYRNAWTIDGNLVADFITAGTMLADRIRGGVLELGGTGLGKDGSIIVKDAAGNPIGSWDKTGLHILLGVIEGSTIKGSSIIGGNINIGNGTFEVNQDGDVMINSGEIDFGDIKFMNGLADFGGFRITGEKFGLLYSTDPGNTVQIYSSAFEYENGPVIILQKGDYNTRIGCGGMRTHDITLKNLEKEYGNSWGSVSLNIIELWNRLIALENSIN